MTGGVAPFSFSVVSGVLPDGLSLLGDVISGVPTTVQGPVAFGLRAVDAVSNTILQTCSIKTYSPPVVSCPSPSVTGVGVSYGSSVLVAGGAPPFVASIVSGVLPSPLVLSPSGAISAATISAVPGNYSFSVRVQTSGNGTVTVQCFITVYAAPVPSCPFNLADVGVSYLASVFVSSGAPGGFTLSLVSGTPPPGLTANGLVISGSPSALGSFSFTLRVTDTVGASGTAACTVVVTAPPVVSCQPSRAADVGNSFCFVLFCFVLFLFCFCFFFVLFFFLFFLVVLEKMISPTS